MGIHKTEFVSVPRSGHHMLVDLLKAYFGEALRYCEYYREPEKRFGRCAETNAQKNHDFNLTTPVRKDRRYVIQIRNPIDALASWTNLSRLEGLFQSGQDVRHEYANRLAYWQGFVRKWVVPTIPNRLIVRYENFVQRPEPELARVIRFMTDTEPDELLLGQVLWANPVKPGRVYRVEEGLFVP